MRPLIASLVLMWSACTAPPPEPDAESATAASRLLALREGDWTTSPRDLAILIEQLESSDPAVRMVAIDGLMNLTGEDHGFRYDDPAAERAAAVLRWAAWLSQRIDSADMDGSAPPQ